VQLPHFVDRHGIKIEFLAHPTAFSRVRFEGISYSVTIRIFKRGQTFGIPTWQRTGLLSRHSDPSISTQADQVGRVALARIFAWLISLVSAIRRPGR
jgi:hypothetical protein